MVSKPIIIHKNKALSLLYYHQKYLKLFFFTWNKISYFLIDITKHVKVAGFLPALMFVITVWYHDDTKITFFFIFDETFIGRELMKELLYNILLLRLAFDLGFTRGCCCTAITLRGSARIYSLIKIILLFEL